MAINNEIMIDTTFLKRFTEGPVPSFFPEILEIEAGLTNVPWLTVPVPRIEPDDWDLFWKMWEDYKRKSEKFSDIWDFTTIWVNPKLKFENPELETDWSKYFPNMFKKINEAMPFESIDKITIASNVKPVPVHIDTINKFYPWPNAMRVMLWDTNTKPTFYLTKWQEDMYKLPIIKDKNPLNNQLYYLNNIRDEEKIYVNLPTESNTFVYSNGEFLHGADLAEFKIILIVWGTPDATKWKQRLRDMLNHEINKR